MSASPPAPAKRPAGPGRDPWFDNAKMALVTLVVVGHGLVMLRATDLQVHLYDFLYAWHMPAFVLITGYLSRNFAYSRQRLWSLVRSVAVPYVIMEGALAYFRVAVGGETLHDIWVVSHWPMWFLLALFFWRLGTPVLRRLGWWAVPVAVALSLAGGYITFDYLSVRRILGFLPFFVIGMCLTPKALDLLRSVPGRIIGAGALVGIWALTANTDQWAQTRWFYYSWAYESLTETEYPALVTRGVVLTIGLVGALAALALVPRRGGWYTRMGTASLVVYLCHGFVVKAVEYSPYPQWAHDNAQLALILNVLGAVVLALLLASPWVSRRLERAVDPIAYAETQVDTAVQLHAKAEELGTGDPGHPGDPGRRHPAAAG